jgi:hypothetical protein
MYQHFNGLSMAVWGCLGLFGAVWVYVAARPCFRTGYVADGKLTQVFYYLSLIIGQKKPKVITMQI